jgi:hypothetical protein
MAKRLKKKVYGIRPHVFHIWADDLVEGIQLQHERLLTHGLPANSKYLGDGELIPVMEVINRRARLDFEFYFVALRRLLRTAESAVREGYGGDKLRAAIKDFKAALPGLVDVRDSAEHADDWLRTGQTRSWGIGLGGGDASFSHGNDRFTLGQTSAAARLLYHAIKEAVPSGAPAEILPALRPGEGARAIAEATWHRGDPD